MARLQRHRSGAWLEPVLVVEVLSPRTEREDRGRKKFDYFATPSSLQYAIIEQDERRIELYTRASNKSTNEVIEGYGALKPSSIGIEVSLDAIYDDIGLDTIRQRGGDRQTRAS